jgi:type IV fimbrial biogenesis protein FimT
MHRPPSVHWSGFSLVELLVALALVGLLCGLAIPRLSDLFHRYRVDVVHEALLASLQLARVEAMRQGVSVIVERQTGCTAALGSGNNWSCGWLIYADLNGNSSRDTASEPLLQVNSLPPQTQLIKSANPPLARVWADRFGQIQPLALNFLIRPDSGNTAQGGILCMGAGARFRWIRSATSCA